MEGFHKLKAGMTEREVCDILGGPAGDYSNGGIERLWCWRQWGTVDWGPNGPNEVAWTNKQWIGGALVVTVYFDTDGKVIGAVLFGTVRSKESVFQKLRR